MATSLLAQLSTYKHCSVLVRSGQCLNVAERWAGEGELILSFIRSNRLIFKLAQSRGAIFPRDLCLPKRSRLFKKIIRFNA